MRRALKIVIGIVLLAQAVWAQEKIPNSRLELVSADQLRSFVVQGRAVRVLEGNVHFRQGSAHMYCQRATEYPRERKTVFEGDVRINDKDRSLRAKKVIYFDVVKLYKASGDVVLVDGTTKIDAQQVFYYSKERKAIADRDVVVFNREENVRLTARHAEHFRDRNYTKVTGDPVATQLDSTGEEVIRLLGDEIEAFQGGKRITVSRNVRVFHDQTQAKSELANFFPDDEEIVLTEKPVAWQETDEMRGDTLIFRFKERQLREVQVLNQAQVISKIDTIEGVTEPNSLRGQKIFMYLQGQYVSRVLVEGTATSVYNAIDGRQFKGMNRVQGDRIILNFFNRALLNVIITSDPGKSNGVFTPPGLQVSGGASTGSEPGGKTGSGEKASRGAKG